MKHTNGLSAILFALASVLPALSPLTAGDWPTAQGELSRDGCPDDHPGPESGSVLWAFPGESHYFASAAIADGRLFFSALGAFNSPEVVAFDLAEEVSERRVWTQQNVFELPTASSPVVHGGIVYVGEGLHQNVAGALTALSVSDGLPLWRHTIEGELRHLEGAVAVDAGRRLYFGCGTEGVVSLDGSRVTSQGRVYPIEAYERLARQTWAKLLLAYEKEKVSDPDFAVAPTADDLIALLDPSVTTRWTAGRNRWHVDSSVALVEPPPGSTDRVRRVIVGSAFLDEEQDGYRGVVCLDADSGKTLWTLPVQFNPWSSPSIAQVGKKRLAVLGTSSIRFDPRTIPGARGQVVAVDIVTGKLEWSVDVRGGVLSAVAIDTARGHAIFAATDGFVRCVKVDSGETVWRRGGLRPYFGGVAIAGARAYAVDLEGHVRAFDAAGGDVLWNLDLARDPKVGRPGRAYSSAVCFAGRLYVGTNNLEGENSGRPAAVVCIGERSTKSGVAVGVEVDIEGRRVSVDVEIAPRKLPHLDKVYPIEVMATSPDGKKAHETVLVTRVNASAVHRALESLGLRPGKPAVGAKGRPSGPEVRLVLELAGREGLVKRIDLARTVVDRRSGLGVGVGGRNAADRVRWFFTGSSLIEPEEEGGDPTYGADFSGTLVTVYPVTSETVFQSSLGLQAEAFLSLETAPNLPGVGTKAKLVIEPVETTSGKVER